MALSHHPERHRYWRIGWLRAAVLGADDGIVSVASLMIGVAAASASRNELIVVGVAGLVAGAMSMAAGEFVSVSSQRDTERADIARERRELHHEPESELTELTNIYIRRGLDPTLAREVARQLTDADPLESHLRDELGITDAGRARPWQAAAVSAGSFVVGAAIPLLAIVITSGGASDGARIAIIALVGLTLLAVAGAVGGRIGGASPARAALRVLAGGGLAMVLTALIGTAVGSAV